MDRRVLAIVLITAAIIYGIVQLAQAEEYSGILLFFAAIAVLIVSGELISRFTTMGSGWGILLWRTKKGIELVKSLSRNAELWKALTDIGIGICFGLAAYFIIDRGAKGKIAVLAASMVLITLLVFLVSPMVFPFLSVSLGMPIGAGRGAHAESLLGPLLTMSAIYLGGFALFITAGLVVYGFSTLMALLGSVLLGNGAISEVEPGVTLLLPGVNLPLFEGILALFIILVVHEGAHAIMAAIGRVPILSSGIAFFGIIPVGAFVEPDERLLFKKSRTVQNRVMAAGSSSNLMFSLVFFLLLMGFLYVSDPYKEHGWLLLEGSGNETEIHLENSTVIYSVNGMDVRGLEGIQLNVSPGETVTLETSKGIMEREVNEEGRLGLFYMSLSWAPLAMYENPALTFVFKALVLAFCLNFVVGVVNLLPLPFFDGYRLLELNLPKKKTVKLVMYVTLAAFLMNLLPWFFK